MHSTFENDFYVITENERKPNFSFQRTGEEIEMFMHEVKQIKQVLEISIAFYCKYIFAEDYDIVLHNSYKQCHLCKNIYVNQMNNNFTFELYYKFNSHFRRGKLFNKYQNNNLFFITNLLTIRYTKLINDKVRMSFEQNCDITAIG